MAVTIGLWQLNKKLELICYVLTWIFWGLVYLEPNHFNSSVIWTFLQKLPLALMLSFGASCLVSVLYVPPLLALVHLTLPYMPCSKLKYIISRSLLTHTRTFNFITNLGKLQVEWHAPLNREGGQYAPLHLLNNSFSWNIFREQISHSFDMPIFSSIRPINWINREDIFWIQAWIKQKRL